MKNIFLLFAVCVSVITLLDNCKRDQPVKKQTQNNEPDSTFIGTRYYFTVPNRFPDIAPNMVGDTSTMTVEGIQLGRMLFYDKHLSVDGHKACASCHLQQYAFSDGGKALSTNEFGPTKRNAPSIQNLAFAPYMFWDGRQPTLSAQAADASQHELGLIAVSFIDYLQKDTTYVKLFKKAFGRPGTITENNIFNAIQQFEMTLISNNSTYDQLLQPNSTVMLSSSASLGLTEFMSETADCFHCHTSTGNETLLLTDNLFRNNGLDSALTINDFPDPGRGGITGSAGDYGKFKDPSMRNIALTGPYMHDGRYKTLMQVVNHYSDTTYLSPTIDPLLLTPVHHLGRGLQLDSIQKQAVVDFLYALTDTSFITNPNFSDPFKH